MTHRPRIQRTRLSGDALEQALREVIPDEDEVVIVFSRLWTIGSRLDFPGRELPGRMLDILLDVVGGGRTLLIPGYCFAFGSERR